MISVEVCDGYFSVILLTTKRCILNKMSSTTYSLIKSSPWVSENVCKSSKSRCSLHRYDWSLNFNYFYNFIILFNILCNLHWTSKLASHFANLYSYYPISVKFMGHAESIKWMTKKIKYIVNEINKKVEKCMK